MSRKHWAYRIGRATAWLVIWLLLGLIAALAYTLHTYHN